MLPLSTLKSPSSKLFLNNLSKWAKHFEAKISSVTPISKALSGVIAKDFERFLVLTRSEYLAIGAWAVLDRAERNSDSVVPPSDLLRLANSD